MRKMSVVTTGQNSRPIPNCAADHSGCPSGTPAKGTSTLPTTGMTSAGVRPAQVSPPACGPRHHRDATQTVTDSCPIAPTHQMLFAIGMAFMTKSFPPYFLWPRIPSRISSAFPLLPPNSSFWRISVS